MTRRILRLKAQGLAGTLVCLCLGTAIAVSAAAATLPQGIPFKTSTPADDNLVYRAVAAFLLACLAAYGIAWCLKRYLPGVGKAMGEGKQLERLEVMRLSQRSALMRVRWGNEELLIGENEHGIALLGKRPLVPSHAATGEAQAEGKSDGVAEQTVTQKETHD